MCARSKKRKKSPSLEKSPGVERILTGRGGGKVSVPILSNFFEEIIQHTRGGISGDHHLKEGRAVPLKSELPS